MCPVYFEVHVSRSEDYEKFEPTWKKLLEGGSVFLYPTETIYGLGVTPFKNDHVFKIFEIKGRTTKKPIPLIAYDIHAVQKAWADFPEWIKKIANRFWPGPLTIIYKASATIAPSVHAGIGKVGIRISSHPIARAIAKFSGGLITATSANLSGQPPITNISKGDENLITKVDVVIDAGPSKSSVPSTVIDCTCKPPALVRQGTIPFEDILKVI